MRSEEFFSEKLAVRSDAAEPQFQISNFKFNN